MNRPSRARRFGSMVMTFFGELFLTVGVVIALFVFWQLYWTTWQVEGDRDKIATNFARELPAGSNKVSTDIRTDAPPIPKPTAEGGVFANLHFPRWNHMVIPATQGTTAAVLDRANAGHYPTTAMPGEIGNASFAAHRRSYGNSFRLVHELKDGDNMIVETADAWMIYKVQRREIVDPDKISVIAPVPNQPEKKPTERISTLTTCDPEYGNSHRYIVHLKFDHWVPRASGIPAELNGDH